MADDVRDGLAGGASADESLVAIGEPVRFDFVAGAEKSRRVPAEKVFRQQARVQIGFVGRNAGALQTLPRCGDARVNGRQETAVASLSFSDW
jgi:hypothetical protein